MARFRLLAGQHRHGKSTGTQVVYRPGDIITSSSDLVAQFGADRFELVADVDASPGTSTTLQRARRHGGVGSSPRGFESQDWYEV